MAIRECDCREFQDSGHTDECNEHYRPKLDFTEKEKALARHQADIRAEIGGYKS